MINKKDIKLFFIVLLINAISLIAELFYFGVKFSKNVFMLVLLFSVVESLLIDKFSIRGGIVDGE